MLTQCPQCHTAFRVSEAQLELAAGQVRCGQCLHVFIAKEHFIDAPPADHTGLVAPDEITIPDLEACEHIAEVELEATELDMPELEATELDMPDLQVPSLEALDDRAKERLQTETDTAVPPIEVPEETPPQALAAETVIEASAGTQTVARAWLGRDAANEERREEDFALEETLTGHGLPAAEAGDHPGASSDDAVIPLLVETYDTRQLYPELASTPAIERPRHTGLYSLAILALLAVFVVQGIYALRDTLAGQPALRPLMGDFCAAFDCAITLPREPEKIRLTHSEVRSHPAQSHALLVKASMQNQARFRQAYPILRLQFSDLDGRPVIGRDFMPEEYLPDDVNIKAGMPVNSNVNLSLELIDPGGQAVSFDFNLL